MSNLSHQAEINKEHSLMHSKARKGIQELKDFSTTKGHTRVPKISPQIIKNSKSPSTSLTSLTMFSIISNSKAPGLKQILFQ